jgi:hypothetical protein
MSVRALDVNGDWTFGSGRNNYLTGNAAVGQEIRSNLLSFLRDCFFSMADGIDWFAILGFKNTQSAQLAIAGRILNTPGVTGIKKLQVDLAPGSRRISVSYQVQTVYSTLTSSTQFDLIQ